MPASAYEPNGLRATLYLKRARGSHLVLELGDFLPVARPQFYKLFDVLDMGCRLPDASILIREPGEPLELRRGELDGYGRGWDRHTRRWLYIWRQDSRGWEHLGPVELSARGAGELAAELACISRRLGRERFIVATKQGQPIAARSALP